MTDEKTRQAALEKIDRAFEVIAGLCDGTLKWTMSVPARPDSDPDLVIAHALSSARVALAATAAPAEPPNDLLKTSYEKGLTLGQAIKSMAAAPTPAAPSADAQNATRYRKMRERCTRETNTSFETFDQETDDFIADEW